MPSDIDIYRAASVIIKQYGEDAPIHAAMRADAMLDKGDLARAGWRRGGASPYWVSSSHGWS